MEGDRGLRSTRADLETFVFDCDYGVGIVRRRASQRLLDLGDRRPVDLTYEDLERDRLGLLGPRAQESIPAFLDSLKS